MFFALVLFALVVVAGTLHRTGLVGIFALSFLSVLWLLVNKGVEHESLLTLSTGHGITTLDAAGLAGLLLVGAQLVRVGWSALRRAGRERTQERRQTADEPGRTPVDERSGDRAENSGGPV